jgi:hypothetical protein
MRADLRNRVSRFRTLNNAGRKGLHLQGRGLIDKMHPASHEPEKCSPRLGSSCYSSLCLARAVLGCMGIALDVVIYQFHDISQDS